MYELKIEQSVSYREQTVFKMETLWKAYNVIESLEVCEPKSTKYVIQRVSETEEQEEEA